MNGHREVPRYLHTQPPSCVESKNSPVVIRCRQVHMGGHDVKRREAGRERDPVERLRFHVLEPPR